MTRFVPMTRKLSTRRESVKFYHHLILVAVLATPSGLLAQNLDRPIVNLKYKELSQRQEFKFLLADKGEFSKPVGDMMFQFAPGTAPREGLDADFRTYCAQPLVPIYANQLYDFAVTRPNEAKYFGLPETDAGRVETERRMFFIRELYGRYFVETMETPTTSSPAFQVALWEIISESNVPEGPMPFNLFGGNFRASYPNEEAAPEYVQRAQKFLLSLTGNDAPFRESRILQGFEITRLDGVAGADGATPQSQLALRAVPGLAPALGESTTGSNSGNNVSQLSPFGGPLSSTGAVGGGGGGSRNPGFGGAPGGGAPVGGGGAGGFFGGGGGGNSPVNPSDTDSSGGGTSPQNPDTGTISQPPPIRDPILPPESIIPPNDGETPIPPVLPSPPGGGGNPPDPPGGGGDPPPVVPAPPAVILLGLGAMALGARRYLRKNS
jgi:hypothetical protein